MPAALTSIEPLLPILSIERPGVFSDIDGTLAPIVETPEEARADPGCLQSLRALIGRGVAVGLITGRTLEMALEMAPVPGAAYGTSHGLVISVGGTPEAPRGLKVYEALARSVLSRFGLRDEWLLVEDKTSTLAFHYRRAPDPEAARARIISELQRIPEAAQFKMQEARRVVELFPDLKLNKGTALEELVEKLDVTGVVCAGDDLTDVALFEAARKLSIPSVSVAVRSAEITPAVLGAADYVVDGVSGVEWMLSEIVRQLSGTSPSAP
jgi:trehalose 6-phosphate phosphatase